MGLISRVSSRTYRNAMPQVLDEELMSPCWGESQMSLNCRAMYSDRETDSSFKDDGVSGLFGVKKPAEECEYVIENYRNCTKFWTKFLRQNNLRMAPKSEDREQILNYMKKTGTSPYEYVEPSDTPSNVPVDVNIGRDMERLKKQEEFEKRYQAKLKEKFGSQEK